MLWLLTIKFIWHSKMPTISLLSNSKIKMLYTIFLRVLLVKHFFKTVSTNYSTINEEKKFEKVNLIFGMIGITSGWFH